MFLFRVHIARICFRNVPRTCAESSILMDRLFYPSRYMAEAFKDMPSRAQDSNSSAFYVCLMTLTLLLYVFVNVKATSRGIFASFTRGTGTLVHLFRCMEIANAHEKNLHYDGLTNTLKLTSTSPSSNVSPFEIIISCKNDPSKLQHHDLEGICVQLMWIVIQNLLRMFITSLCPFQIR